MAHRKSKIFSVHLIRANGKLVPESAKFGNALDATRHVSIVEVLGVFMLYFALHQVMYGARSHSSIAGYRSLRNGRSAAARLMGLMQPEPGPITPRVLLEVAIGNQKPCHQHSRFLPVPRASARNFCGGDSQTKFMSIKFCCKKVVVRAQYVKAPFRSVRYLWIAEVILPHDFGGSHTRNPPSALAHKLEMVIKEKAFPKARLLLLLPKCAAGAY